MSGFWGKNEIISSLSCFVNSMNLVRVRIRASSLFSCSRYCIYGFGFVVFEVIAQIVLNLILIQFEVFSAPIQWTLSFCFLIHLHLPTTTNILNLYHQPLRYHFLCSNNNISKFCPFKLCSQFSVGPYSTTWPYGCLILIKIVNFYSFSSSS